MKNIIGKLVNKIVKSRRIDKAIAMVTVALSSVIVAITI